MLKDQKKMMAFFRDGGQDHLKARNKSCMSLCDDISRYTTMSLDEYDV